MNVYSGMVHQTIPWTVSMLMDSTGATVERMVGIFCMQISYISTQVCTHLYNYVSFYFIFLMYSYVYKPY